MDVYTSSFHNSDELAGFIHGAARILDVKRYLVGGAGVFVATGGFEHSLFRTPCTVISSNILFPDASANTLLHIFPFGSLSR
jgi:hypothetical protein